MSRKKDGKARRRLDGKSASWLRPLPTVFRLALGAFAIVTTFTHVIPTNGGI